MDPHSIQLPREILVGNDVIGSLPDLCKRLGLTGRALVLCDEKTRVIAGDRVKALLKGSNADLFIVKESTTDEVGRVCERNVGFMMNVGGGTVIDVGKLAATRLSVPFVSVPTAPSHDGIASERASIRDGVERVSLRANAPVAIVADLDILRNAPYRLVASGCADAISNYTAVHDWKLGRDRGEYFSEYAASLSLLAAEIVMSSAEAIRAGEERGMRNLVEALISSGIAMSMVDSSRPASGAEHMFSHALDYMKSPGLHGEQCGLGSIVTSYWQGQDWKKVRSSLEKIGAPVTAQGLGLSKEAFTEAFLSARNVRKDRYTILDDICPTREDVIAAGEATGVL